MNYRGVPYQNRNEYDPDMPYNYSIHTTPSPPQPMSSPYEYYETPFEYYAKPEQPPNWYPPEQPYNHPNYPEQPMNQTSTFTQPNQSETTQFDFNTMLSTVGLLADTAQQVSPFIKQIGAMVKTFR